MTPETANEIREAVSLYDDPRKLEFVTDLLSQGKTREEAAALYEPLLPCPHCGYHAHAPERVHGQRWGSYDWEVRCSSSHCGATVHLVAADEYPDPYDRYVNVRKKWNRRTILTKSVMSQLIEALKGRIYTPRPEEEWREGQLERLESYNATLRYHAAELQKLVAFLESRE